MSKIMELNLKWCFVNTSAIRLQGLNPDYSLAILFRAKIPSRSEASQLF